MRLRALVAGLVLLVLSAVVFTTGAGRGAAPAANAPLPPPTATPGVPATAPPLPGRNVFEYADEEAAPVPSASGSLPAPVEMPPRVAAPQQSPDSVRLIGFVRRGGALRAALALRGSVYVLGAGEGAEGYVLLAADEDAGVRIQDLGGAVLTLPPPS